MADLTVLSFVLSNLNIFVSINSEILKVSLAHLVGNVDIYTILMDSKFLFILFWPYLNLEIKFDSMFSLQVSYT